MYYHVERVLVEQHLRRQFEDAPEEQPPNPEHQQTSFPIALRYRLSIMLHALADAIGPPPTVEDRIPSQQT